MKLFYIQGPTSTQRGKLFLAQPKNVPAFIRSTMEKMHSLLDVHSVYGIAESRGEYNMFGWELHSPTTADGSHKLPYNIIVKRVQETFPSDNINDYSACVECGFDHSYERIQSKNWHKPIPCSGCAEAIFTGGSWGTLHSCGKIAPSVQITSS
jgi:hypothetical protein